MKNTIRKCLIIALALVFILGFSACGSGNDSADSSAPEAQEVEITANTGTYIGTVNKGVQQFLGIKYGDMEPFKAPTDVATTKDDVMEAKEYGFNCIQEPSEVELASQDPCSQDCLYLNIWTKDANTKGKPVIVFAHGGGFVAGGTSDPMYDGQYFVRNLPDGEDCVFVSINYRLQFLGGIDLSICPDYTDEYKDAINLKLLDQIQALKWVNENIEAWGGDKDCVTYMGQSAGAMSVQALMTNDEATKYFNRAFSDSGSPSYGLVDEAKAKETAQTVFDILGIKTIKELTDLTDEEITAKMTEIAQNTKPVLVTDGDIMSENWWNDIVSGKAKDIDLMIGCTGGECDMFSIDWENSVSEPITDETAVYNMLRDSREACKHVMGKLYAFGYEGDDPTVADEYMALGEDKVKQAQDLYNDLSNPYPNMLLAEAQSKYNDHVYNYYFNFAPDKDAVVEFNGDAAEVSPWGRPLHCTDLCFTMGTLKKGYVELTGDYKLLPKDLTKQMQLAVYNFAKTGDPNNDSIPEWKAYNNDTKSTMVINEDASWSCESDYRSERMNVLRQCVPYGQE